MASTRSASRVETIDTVAKVTTRRRNATTRTAIKAPKPVPTRAALAESVRRKLALDGPDGMILSSGKVSQREGESTSTARHSRVAEVFLNDSRAAQVKASRFKPSSPNTSIAARRQPTRTQSLGSLPRRPTSRSSTITRSQSGGRLELGRQDSASSSDDSTAEREIEPRRPETPLEEESVDDRSQLLDEVKRQSRKLEQSRGTIATMEHRNAELQKTLSQHRHDALEEIASLKRQMSEQKTQYERKISKERAHSVSLKQAVASKEQALASAESSLKLLENQVKQATSDQQKEQKRASSLESKLAALRAKHEALARESVAQPRPDVSDLEARLQAASKRADVAEKRVTDLEEELQAHLEKATQLDSTIAQLHGDIQAAAATTATIRRENEKLGAQLGAAAETQAELHAAKSSLTASAAEISALRDENQELRGQIAAAAGAAGLQEELLALKSTHRQALEDLQHEQSLRTAAENQLLQAQHRHVEDNTQVTSLHASLEASQAEVDKLKRTCEEAKTTVLDLRKQISDAQSRQNEAQQSTSVVSNDQVNQLQQTVNELKRSADSKTVAVNQWRARAELAEKQLARVLEDEKEALQDVADLENQTHDLQQAIEGHIRAYARLSAQTESLMMCD